MQNKNLGIRLEQRKRIEEHLRQRIEQLELRQSRDDALLCIVNRHWNQVQNFFFILIVFKIFWILFVCEEINFFIALQIFSFLHEN